MRTVTGKEPIISQCANLLSDESKYRCGIPKIVFYPESADDLRSILADASKQGTPVTVMGGKTGITGSSVPVEGCHAIVMSGMNRIVRVEQDNAGSPLLACEPGITLSAIEGFLNDPASQSPIPPGAEMLQPGTLMYPPDPTEMTAQLGGTIATNASGARSYAFGSTRNHVLAVTVVFANGDTGVIDRRVSYETGAGFSITTDQGTVLTVPRPPYASPSLKNASGYFSQPDMHLIDLFIGSEGTLCIIADATIALVPRPEIIAGLTFLPGRAEAFALAEFLRTQSSVLAIEYFDQSALSFMVTRRDRISEPIPDFPKGMTTAVYWEFHETSSAPFDGVMDAWENAFKAQGTSFDQTWSGFEPDERTRLKAFRHALPELVNNQIAQYQASCPEIRKISTDAAVPAEAFSRVFAQTVSMIESCTLEYVCFGHLGDYHLHFNLIPKTRTEMNAAIDVYKKVMRMVIQSSGTVSAEHGIGKLKREYLAAMYGPAVIAEMRRIKTALDPAWVLNPGNLFLRD